jgi:hypothetical protein
LTYVVALPLLFEDQLSTVEDFIMTKMSSSRSSAEIKDMFLELGIDDLWDDASYQDISRRNINPAKLTAMLRTKFGVGSYEVNVGKLRCS